VSGDTQIAPVERREKLSDSVYVFDARLVDYTDVRCMVGVRGSQTLEHLHRGLRRAFNWDDDHLYSFWLSGVYWDGPESEFTAPYELEMSDAHSAAVRLDQLDLRPGQQIAYVFDFGDEWRVLLHLREHVPAEPGARYPKVLMRNGEPPPQYTYDDE
jgi:Plasmid pRiA4b ORF-3-like protein